MRDVTCYGERDADRPRCSNVTDVARVVAGVVDLHRVDHQMTTVDDLHSTSSVNDSPTCTLPPGPHTDRHVKLTDHPGVSTAPAVWNALPLQFRSASSSRR